MIPLGNQIVDGVGRGGGELCYKIIPANKLKQNGRIRKPPFDNYYELLDLGIEDQQLLTSKKKKKNVKSRHCPS